METVSAQQPIRCEFCGAVSHLTHLFERWPTGLRSRAPICPRCRNAPGPGSRLPVLLAWLALAAVVVVGFFVGGPVLAFDWLLGAAVLPALLIVVHECSHALAGLLVGARVFEVRFGWGRATRELRLGRVRFSITPRLLHGGACVAAFLRPPVARWRYAVLYGTPMLLHFAALVAVWPFLTVPWPPASIGLAHFFFLYNALLLFLSARPVDYRAGAYRFPNDGKALLRLRSRAVVSRWFRRGLILPALYALADGDREQSIAHAWRLEGQYPDDPIVGRSLFTAYWALGCYVDALRFLQHYAHSRPAPEGETDDDLRRRLALGVMTGERYERWLKCVVCLHGSAWEAARNEVRSGLEAEPWPEGRALLLALLANVRLLEGVELDQAEAAARAAFEMLPWVPFVCDTYAASLIERGEVEKGLLLLAEAKGPEGDDRERSVCNAWRAVAYARRGLRAPARRWLRQAQRRGLEIGPPPALLAKAEALLAE